jgi:hypothetical protein
MPVYRAVDVKEWNDDRKREACLWCWGHDYGNCDLCVLYKGAKNTEQQPDEVVITED